MPASPAILSAPAIAMPCQALVPYNYVPLGRIAPTSDHVLRLSDAINFIHLLNPPILGTFSIETRRMSPFAMPSRSRVAAGIETAKFAFTVASNTDCSAMSIAYGT